MKDEGIEDLSSQTGVFTPHGWLIMGWYPRPDHSL